MNICLPLKPFTVQLSSDLQGKQALSLVFARLCCSAAHFKDVMS